MENNVVTISSPKVKCLNCSDEQNLPINIVCVKCQRPLIKLKWFHFFIYMLSICLTGFILAILENVWLSVLFVELLVFTFLILVLREEINTQRTFIIAFLIIAPVLFFLFYGKFSPPTQAVLIGFLVACAVLYFAITYFIKWEETCVEFGISRLEGFSVISFSLYLLLLIIDLIFNSLGTSFLEKKIVFFNFEVTLSQIHNLMRGSITIRSFLLIVTLIQIMFVALINSVKRKVPRPESLFKSKTEIYPISFSHKHSIHDLFFKMAQTMINILIQFSIVVIEFSKTMLNVVKITSEYVFNLFRNYAFEILRLIGDLIKAFLKTNYYFFKKHVIPLFLVFVIVVQSNFLLKNIFDYIQTGAILSFLGVLFHLFMIFLEIFIYILLVTNHKFIETIYSLASSYMWILFVTFICVLISSWILFLISKPIENFQYKIGPFTIISTSLLVIFVLVTFVLRQTKGSGESIS